MLAFLNKVATRLILWELNSIFMQTFVLILNHAAWSRESNQCCIMVNVKERQKKTRTERTNNRQQRVSAKVLIYFEIPHRDLVIGFTWWCLAGSRDWRSGESAGFPRMCAEFDSRTARHMWAEFVGSIPRSEGFFSGYSGFPVSSKTSSWLNLVVWFELICVVSLISDQALGITWHLNKDDDDSDDNDSDDDDDYDYY